MTMDALYLAVLALFFGVTYGLLRLCERLFHDGSGDRP